MALNEYRGCPFGRWGMTPTEQYFRRFMNEAMRGFDRSFMEVAPYWLEQPHMQEVNIGNALGKVIDDKDRFAVEIDVSQFKPEELKVNVVDKELVIEGRHEERMDEHGKIERHFVRKYLLPKESTPENIISHLSDTGVLTVTALKHTIQHTRNIPIMPAQKEMVKNKEETLHDTKKR